MNGPVAARPDPALAGEILGASVLLERAPGIARLPLGGTLVDESLRTFLVRAADGRERRIPKAGLEGTIFLGGRELPLRGDSLELRPEDRTQRLAWGDRRRRS